jgi:single-strand selective monofunctional uracil DNA glycosylase
MKFPAAAHIYNPLEYARAPHELYLQRYGRTRKRVVFLGMNPGPFGMAQTGVPFGEVSFVRDWLGIQAAVGQPPHPHPKRPVLGFDCTRSEVSGSRLWGFFAKKFRTPERFFAGHFVANYCPLAFLSQTGSNVTPDKFSATCATKLFSACDDHLREMIRILQPEWVIGIGAFARQRAESALATSDIRIGQILHPSPASPAANRDWPGQACRQLEKLGVW